MDWQILWDVITDVCLSIVLRLLGALLVLIVGRSLVKLLLKHFPSGSEKHRLDPTTRQFFMSMTKVALYVLLIVIIVGILGVPMASVIAVVGSAGAAIALALQGSLSNLAAGIMLLIFKPLKLRDYVETNGVGGSVADLGIFYTTLITGDNRHIIIPNSSLINATITNFSREKNRRVDLVFTADYGTDTKQARELILKTVVAHPRALADPAPFVRMTELTDSSLHFTVRVWCKAEDFLDVKLDLTEQIKELFDQNGISIPYPQLDVHVKQ